ncbi:aminoglycoside phosphotransferase family protein [Alicyclobacillus tolerans]|uniref:phosphotransferase family protein n=1 Tax=Alicyclobacillus tolerans TaxID=90970 RepID=UPI001F2D2575|nr:aminoglycoside phosphotransferase family protein [Alicyclobacillus tolerans]MCF8565821.1 aminoglycoside phosphotransferase family protein [Alicyclobacillus tolerans]
MNLSLSSEVIQYLKDRGLLDRGDLNVSVEPFSGGVSSDVVRVQTPNAAFVLKQALPKLRVQEDWYADLKRGVLERQCLQWAIDVIPHSVPKVLLADDANGVFAMEYIQGPVWKKELLDGQVDVNMAVRVGELLAKVHRQSHRQKENLTAFFDKQLFYELRIAPYFAFVRDRLGPGEVGVSKQLDDVMEHMMTAQDVLVHGDFSPKNIILAQRGPILLDWEVAHIGHPSFDIAFLLNHLLLKAMHLPALKHRFVEAAESFYNAYFSAVEVVSEPALRNITLRTLGALMVARVDGKSPVEYLTEAQQNQARQIGFLLLENSMASLRELGVALGTA